MLRDARAVSLVDPVEIHSRFPPLPTNCSRALFTAVTFLACVSHSSLHAQVTEVKQRAASWSAASVIPLANNGEPLDIAGLGGIRIA